MTDPSSLREREPVRAGHRIPLGAQDWPTVSNAVAAGHGWYVAAVATDGDRVAFVRNRWSDGWVLPGGKRGRDERLRAATRRELREETGLDAEVTDPVAAIEQTFPHAGDRVTGHLLVFAARVTDPALAADPGEDAEEIADVAWFAGLPERTDGMPRDLLGRVIAEAT